METIVQILARELDRKESQIQAVVDLLDEGNTIPFIARYRKEAHGAMDDTALRTLEGASTPCAAWKSAGRRSNAPSRAGESSPGPGRGHRPGVHPGGGGGPLPSLQGKTAHPGHRSPGEGTGPPGRTPLRPGAGLPAPEVAAADYLNPEKGVETVEEALQGASDLIAEAISDDAALRKSLRELWQRQGRLVSRAAAKEPEDSVYRLYYDFQVPAAGPWATRSWPSTGASGRAF